MHPALDMFVKEYDCQPCLFRCEQRESFLLDLSLYIYTSRSRYVCKIIRLPTPPVQVWATWVLLSRCVYTYIHPALDMYVNEYDCRHRLFRCEQRESLFLDVSLYIYTYRFRYLCKRIRLPTPPVHVWAAPGLHSRPVACLSITWRIYRFFYNTFINQCIYKNNETAVVESPCWGLSRVSPSFPACSLFKYNTVQQIEILYSKFKLDIIKRNEQL